MRVRLIYEKRGGACFVPHVALATVFARSLRRAGILPCSTGGFSPRAKMSFGPELPAGVVALGEAVDLWLEGQPERLVPLLNSQMPDGFRALVCTFLPESAPALGKECRAARYLTRTRNGRSLEELLNCLRRRLGADLLSASEEYPWLSLVVTDPARNGLGGWVKALVGEGLAAGWQDLCFVRLALGTWDGMSLRALGEGARYGQGK